MAKTTNHQAFEGCFRVLIDIWKNENTLRVLSRTLCLNKPAIKCLEAKSKPLKREGKGNKLNATEPLTDVEENILY